MHPLRQAGSLDSDEIAAVRTGLRRALRVGIRRQGATLSDYRTPNGGRGSMQDEFKVYGREGEPCDRCGAALAKTRVAGRGTWFCSSCQPAQASAAAARSGQAASTSSRAPSRSRRQSSV